MLPADFLTRMEDQLGPQYSAFLEAYDRPRAVGLRFNPLKADRFPALPFLRDPVPWAENGWYYDPEARPGLHPFHEAGLYYLQEPSAMAPVTLLDPRPGEVILDLCAAPGGKTTQIAGAMGGRGLLVSNEINPKRARILSRNVERMGATNCLVLNERPQTLEARFPRFFDKILVDAPCSGEGMFRKEEAALTDWSPETVTMCARRRGWSVPSDSCPICSGARATMPPFCGTGERESWSGRPGPGRSAPRRPPPSAGSWGSTCPGESTFPSAPAGILPRRRCRS